MDTSQLLEEFLNLEIENSNGKYFAIEEKLLNDYTATSISQNISRFNEAIDLLIEAPISDAQDENQRTYNAMLMFQIATKTDFDSLDIVHLEEVANQCPLEGGIAVLHARTHLWHYTGLKYINECELLGWEYGEGERRVNISLSTINVLAEPSVLVYPNPASSEIFVELLNCETAYINIFDISGRLCLESELGTINKIQLSEFDNGLYIYNLVSKQRLIKTGRLIINK